MRILTYRKYISEAKDDRWVFARQLPMSMESRQTEKFFFGHFKAAVKDQSRGRIEIDKYLISFALQFPNCVMQRLIYIMSKQRQRHLRASLLCMLVIAVIARAQSPTDNLVTRVSAELAPHTDVHDANSQHLQTAERVVPGDVLIYTVEVRNVGHYAAQSALIVQPIPNHMKYLADSAVGPGVDVDYSIDGGRTFDAAENLKFAGAAARATAADYTHIRWRLRNRLKPNSIAYVRFRAQVK